MLVHSAKHQIENCYGENNTNSDRGRSATSASKCEGATCDEIYQQGRATRAIAGGTGSGSRLYEQLRVSALKNSLISCSFAERNHKQ
jgi:hypothetical protein